MAIAKQKITGDMPQQYHADDEQWIFSQLIKLAYPVRVKVCVAYSGVFSSTFDSEPIEHKKQNKARREANVRLRKYVNRKQNWANIAR